MAHKSISDLAPLTSPADGDLIVVVDVSDTSMSVAGTTKKAARSTFLNGVLTENQPITLSGDVVGTGTTSIVTSFSTVAINKGGTGQTTAADAFNALKQAATTSATGVVELAADGESAANLAVQANDARLSNARTPTAHVHGAADVSSGTLDIARLPVASTGVVDTTKVVRSDDQRLSDARTPVAHTHAIADTTGLQAAIDGKAASSHTHAISDTTGLQAALDGKAATSHTHSIANVTGLQTALDGKAATSHTHAISDTTGLQSALDGKAATAHAHAAADVTSGTLDIARLPVATSGTSNATQVPRADDSRLSNSRTPNGSATGDLSGSYPSPTVAKIQGRVVASTAPTSGQVLAWNSGTSQWTPTTGGGGGGDATSIQTVPVSVTAPTSGQGLIYNSTSSQWEPTNLGTASAANTGDAVFNASAIQSVVVAATSPSNGQGLRYNSTSTQWEPTNLGSAADAATGDAVFNASSIQSTAVSVTSPSNGQTLVFNSTSSQWEPSTPAVGGDLLSTNNLSDVASAATSRTNLGLAIGTDVQAYNAATAFTNVAQSFTQGQRGAISTLTDGATITPNFNSANNFTVTLAGNRTLANPTNVTAGQSGSIFILQDGTGSRTLAFGANWDFAGGTAPVLSTAASAIDRLDYIARSSTSIHAVLTKAYA